MKLIQERCVGCMQCHALCPAHAITARAGKSVIDQDKCLECHTCYRSNVCPAHAFEIEELPWPRSLRSVFSDVLNPHKSTGVLGRGTEEMKTNDVTARLKAGRVGVSIELGRPGVGASFLDAQTVAQAIAAVGVHFQEENPIASLMIDKATGTFDPAVLNERVLSALIEFDIPEAQLGSVLTALEGVKDKVDTVFSVGISFALADDSTYGRITDRLDELGIFHRPNGKTNVGLGKPYQEVRS